ncbi:putative E3 ubiquitin-protein ligase LIN-1 isoform X2 [Diospyros lotus]|uniref:putative E3 ubiquitin-protein ligase LIN-1 isoform X2 n=1 Tax=Diospyros lotus TaxID=55363 RepID=UPI0022579BF1|nr:putative E3 ubiquitin-protein ligase LIN-1 isoform X2 [Diospyros lotus]
MFAMEQKDIVRLLTTRIGSFIQDRLIDREQRTQQKEQCAERLAAEDGSSDKVTEVRYSDQAVLANLDWGIEALEEAINTSNTETKLARLDYAEKMLQVCAMLNASQETAGVPNFYLSAWAHLNLSYLWKLRNNLQNAVLHVLEMFTVDPFFSRIDFAPELWKILFLPHMTSIVGWYAEERHRLLMDVIPDSSDLSFTMDFDQYFNESLIFSMRPDQAEKVKKLEQLYGQSLDENTRLFAKYFKDCLNMDSTTKRKVIPMVPIVEPPMTPLREVNWSIPDYVKFGPILPKSAGFSPILRSRENAREASRLNIASSPEKLEESPTWDLQEGIPEEDEDEIEDEDVPDNEPDAHAHRDSQNEAPKLLSLRSFRLNNYEEHVPNLQARKMNDQMHSPKIASPMDTPKTSSSKLSSPKPDMHCKRESSSELSLLPSYVVDHTISSSLPVSPSLCNNSSGSSVDLDGEITELHKRSRKNVGHARNRSYGYMKSQVLAISSLNESDEGNQSSISLPLSEKLTPLIRPPKDFVCPITSQIFCDPVTLETGQTYERKAIQEWMKRGNTTCPITRQPICANTLPKTNYVLKRLITSWKEQDPDLAQEHSYAETPRSSLSTPSSKEFLSESPCRVFGPSNHRSRNENINNRTSRFVRTSVSTSPTSVISQAALETIINGLKPYITCLCTSEDLQECEAAVLKIAKVWKDSKADPGLHSYLSKPTIVNGFMELLTASMDRDVLRTSVYILSGLIFSDDRVGEILTSVDSDFDCLAALLKNGLAEAAVLIYLLKPAFSQLSAHDLIPSFVHLIQARNEELDDILLVMEPEDAAIEMLEQLLMGGDEKSRCLNAISFISANGIPALMKCLDRVEARQPIVSILLGCIHADSGCKTLIASRIEFSPVLELFYAGSDSVKGICIDFLSELVQSNRRTFCNQILKIIKDEGAFSTMHTLLVYLQMAPMEQQPAVATLLLQLDLLVEPRKMSMYREEAIEALTEALCKKDFTNSQIMALDSLLCLSGHHSPSGKPCTEAWLLKIAGFDQQYNALMKTDRFRTHELELTEPPEEEDKAASSWEKSVAFVLCNHEKGVIFKALEECFKSNSIEVAKSCLIVATWLTHMLYSLPDTGIRDVAWKSLLDQFINVLQSSKNLDEKILASISLKNFITDPGALNQLGAYATCVYKTLRKLKKSSKMVNDILKALLNLPSLNATELWYCAEAGELDSGTNGEVLSLLHLKGCLISGHSDGTIKVWAIKHEEIHCLQVHDVKEPVHELTASTNIACFSSQGTGVKIYNWTGVPKHINFNKSVKCLAMTDSKLYCGCTGYSIQEVDLCKYVSSTFYTGTRKLLGKQTIHSLHIHSGLLLAGGSSVDGTAGKVFSLSSKAVIGSFTTGFDIHQIAASNDLIFTSTKCGITEVWLKERISKFSSIKMGGGGNAKITSLTTDADGDMLFAGSSEGKIRAWSLD